MDSSFDRLTVVAACADATVRLVAVLGVGGVAGQQVSLRFGGVDVLVQATPVAGNEPTSVVSKAAGQVVDAAGQLRSAVQAVTNSIGGMLADLARSPVARPQKVEVELGLGFTVKGNVIVVSGEADASLKLTLTYAPHHADPPPGGSAVVSGRGE